MKPGEAAKSWATQHPEFSGVLLVETQTARGKNGRLGTKKTTYEYIVTEGECAKSKGQNSYMANSNGVCDVTGHVYLLPTLNYYALPHPLRGQPIPGHYVNCVYAFQYFRTTTAQAALMGASLWDWQTRRGGNTPGSEEEDERHPTYQRHRNAPTENIHI